MMRRRKHGHQHHVPPDPDGRARLCRPDERSRPRCGRQFVAENYVNHNAYVEDGREANRAFWAQWFAAFPDTEVSLDDVLVDGDRVAGRSPTAPRFRAHSWACRRPVDRW